MKYLELLKKYENSNILCCKGEKELKEILSDSEFDIFAVHFDEERKFIEEAEDCEDVDIYKSCDLCINFHDIMKVVSVKMAIATVTINKDVKELRELIVTSKKYNNLYKFYESSIKANSRQKEEEDVVYHVIDKNDTIAIVCTNVDVRKGKVKIEDFDTVSSYSKYDISAIRRDISYRDKEGRTIYYTIDKSEIFY